MRRTFPVLAYICLASAVHADALTENIVEQHILPAFKSLSDTTKTLAKVTAQSCPSAPDAVQEAFADAFDAWITASIWRFGPTETDARAFSLAFWPDNRGTIGKTVGALLRVENRDVLPAEAFAEFSIAGKGFYALEFLMFDPNAQTLASADYRCDLAQAMANDIARTADVIETDWTDRFADLMHAPSERYQNDAEIRQELFKTLTTGLQVVDDLRLGRPLGSFDKPRPGRAEAWRSGRSLRHVILSLEALEPLALSLAEAAPELRQSLAHQFERTLKRAAALEDPTFAGVADPASRFRIEALKQDVSELRNLVTTELGPRLGVAAGFNSLDGD